MISSAVVNRYANALVDVATSPAAGIDPKVAGEQLRAFQAAIQSSPDMNTLMASPAVSAVRKRAVIRRIGEALGLHRVVLNFLLVLSDHRRAGALKEMADAYDLLLDERLGFQRAEVRSAYELNEQQRQDLAAQLDRLAGGKVRMHFSVDPDLIGGATARIGSKVYDGSVRGQLASLRQRLAV